MSHTGSRSGYRASTDAARNAPAKIPGVSSGAPSSTLRRLLDDRVSQLSTDLENLLEQTADRARGQLAEQLNQAVRRLNQSQDLEGLAATITDAAGAFANGAALFVVENGTAKGRRIRGVPDEAVDRFVAIELPLSGAAALAGAIESHEPVVTATSSSQVSDILMQFLGHTPDGRASVYPLVAREGVPALLYVWGEVHGAALELLAQVAAVVWIVIEAPKKMVKPAADLVQIADPAKPTWDSLPPEEQQVHLRAQRFARVQVAEMRLYEADAVQSGRARRDLYSALHKSIDQARKNFRESFYTSCPSMVDYLHLELLRTLANDDPELLGKDYPGPRA